MNNFSMPHLSDLLLPSDFFARSWRADELMKMVRTNGVCCVCREEAKQLCSVCRGVRYCSAGCQTLNWKVHKGECAEVKAAMCGLRNIRKYAPSSTIIVRPLDAPPSTAAPT